MAVKFRPQPYRLKWPWTPTQVEGTDEMFGILFHAVKALNDNITTVSSSTGGSSINPGLIVGSIGAVNSDNDNGDETDSSMWSFGQVSGSPNIFTQGSVIFAGPGGSLAQNNANLFWDDTNLSLGIRTSAPTAILHLGAGAAAANNAPLKFAMGTLLTTPEAGAIEYDGARYFLTRATAIREAISTGTFSQTVDVTVANTTTPTSLVGTGVGTTTFPANFFAAGKSFRIEMRGYFSTTANPTADIAVKLGSTTIASLTASSAGNNVSNHEFLLIHTVTCRSAGVNGTFHGQGVVTFYPSHSSPAEYDLLLLTPTTRDTTTSLLLDVLFTWGTADPANTITITNFLIEVLN